MLKPLIPPLETMLASETATKASGYLAGIIVFGVYQNS
jgi:hypothetical protein